MFGVRWQAQRDTAFKNPKRRRRFTLPAHSKEMPAAHGLLDTFLSNSGK
jgi:hypothetical protein